MKGSHFPHVDGAPVIAPDTARAIARVSGHRVDVAPVAGRHRVPAVTDELDLALTKRRGCLHDLCPRVDRGQLARGFPQVSLTTAPVTAPDAVLVRHDPAASHATVLGLGRGVLVHDPCLPAGFALPEP
jgi:hypothetical protein